MQITKVTDLFRGYADYQNSPEVNIISMQKKEHQTIIKATCELPTKTFDKTKDIIYLIYFVYINNKETSDDGGFSTINIVEKTNKNTQYNKNDKAGIFYKSS